MAYQLYTKRKKNTHTQREKNESQLKFKTQQQSTELNYTHTEENFQYTLIPWPRVKQPTNFWHIKYQRLIKEKMHQQKHRTHFWKRKRKKKKKKKRNTEATPAENLSQKTPARQSPLYKPKTIQNYQIFSEATKKAETRVRKNKINNLKNINHFLDLFIIYQ